MLGKAEKVHLIGIGGYGMSGLAKLLLDLGYSVSGSDLTQSDITKHLMEMGAEITFEHNEKNVEGRDVIVYSTAIPEENDELKAGRARCKVLHRSELLAQFLNAKTGIAITGAHGKTTTTTMLALIMERAGLDPTALIGGEVQDFSGTARLGRSQYVVAEADESDQSFARYRPRYAIITNIEADHLEHYNGSFAELLKGYEKFVANIHPRGLLLISAHDPRAKEIGAKALCRTKSFGISRGDYRAEAVVLNSLGSQFNLCTGDAFLGPVQLAAPGKHNVLNAVAAAGLAMELGVEFEAIQAALAVFKGAKRRFQILAKEPFMVVDDYAHHPTEVRATLEADKSIARGRIIAIFQPHRYTRTQYFMEQFARSFNNANIVLLDNIYPASEQPISGVNAHILAEKTAAHHPGQVLHLNGPKAIVQWVSSNWREGDLVLTMGAGSISKVGHQLAEICQQLVAGNFLPKVE
jgi:UDP-N-acetylmuramate--alanine ligase